MPHLHTLSSIFLTLLILPLTSAQLTTTTTPTLNVSAIAARSNKSVLECWAISAAFTTTHVPGTSGALDTFLGSVSNFSYTILPSRFDGGVHNAPYAQWVIFLSGLAHVTLPNTTTGPTTEAWLSGGKYGTIFAADTADLSTFGHITTYPSDADTVTLQIPTADGKVPAHTVLYDGPCQWRELVGE